MNPVPGIAIELQPSAVIHRMLLFGEARGEQDSSGRLESLAMAAVGFVPINRVMRGRWRAKRMDLKAVILEEWQFSCFNPNDPNRAKLLDAHKLDPVSWERADTICDLLESGAMLDLTLGATHYCTSKLWNREPAKPGKLQWYERPAIDEGITKMTRQIGSHVFAVTP